VFARAINSRHREKDSSLILAEHRMADEFTIVDRLSEAGVLENLSAPVQTALFLGALVFLPAALVSVTSFTRIVIVLSFVRRALTTQEIPPNFVVIGLSLFMTLFVMGPTWDEINAQAVTPYLEGTIGGAEAYRVGSGALHKFMLRQTRRQDLALFLHMSGVEAPQEPRDTPLRVLVPAFVISELQTAFVMGFLIFLPFLLVDLVVSSLLTSLGMVMMPPVIISAPFKILLFVLADGWHMVARALSLSFA
jgi:flagellar biosynthetic protein FliP